MEVSKKKRSTREKVIEAVDRVKKGQDNERIMNATGVSYSTVQRIRQDIALGNDPYLRTARERALAKGVTIPTDGQPSDRSMPWGFMALIVFIGIMVAVTVGGK